MAEGIEIMVYQYISLKGYFDQICIESGVRQMYHYYQICICISVFYCCLILCHFQNYITSMHYVVYFIAPATSIDWIVITNKHVRCIYVYGYLLTTTPNTAVVDIARSTWAEKYDYIITC